MSYRIRLEREAVDALARLPKQVREHAAGELRRLAENPGSGSYPAGFPHPPRGQLFDITCTVQGVEHFLTVMFRYAADEEHIDIAWIMHRERPEQNLPGGD